MRVSACVKESTLRADARPVRRLKRLLLCLHARIHSDGVFEKVPVDRKCQRSGMNDEKTETGDLTPLEHHPPEPSR